VIAGSNFTESALLGVIWRNGEVENLGLPVGLTMSFLWTSMIAIRSLAMRTGLWEHRVDERCSGRTGTSPILVCFQV
jgi:hypothetical protein